MAYGIRRIVIPTASNLAIAGIAFAFSALAAVAGSYAGHLMPARAADLFGAVLIIGIGIWMLQPLSVAACNALLSFVSLWCGVWLGRRYGEYWLGRKADILAALLLILLGVHQALQG